jgi:hypothetical protein
MTELDDFIQYKKNGQNLADIAYDEDHVAIEQSPASAPGTLQPDILDYPLIVIVKHEER